MGQRDTRFVLGGQHTLFLQLFVRNEKLKKERERMARWIRRETEWSRDRLPVLVFCPFYDLNAYKMESVSRHLLTLL